MKSLYIAVLFFSFSLIASPVLASDLINTSRGDFYIEYINDVLSGTNKLEEEINWTLKGDDFTLSTRYGNNWPFPFQEKDPRLLKRFINLELGDHDVTAGNFSMVIGKGIVLTATEDRPLGRDTQLDGIKWDYGTGDFNTTAFYGIHKSWANTDYPIGVVTAGDPDRLWGNRVAYDFGDLDVEGYYLNTYINDNVSVFNDAFMGFDVTLNLDDWRFYFEHDFRDTFDGLEDGRANLAEVSGGWSELAVTLQYKDYWNMFHPYGTPPRLRRGDMEEASINPNDDKGFMATLVYSPEFLSDGYLTTIFAGSDDTNNARPFHEFFIEYQHDLLLDTTFSLGYDYLKGTLQQYNNMTAKYKDFILGIDHAMGENSMHAHLRYTLIDGAIGNEEESETGLDFNYGDDLVLSFFYETSSKDYELPAIGQNTIPTLSPGKWFAFKVLYDIDDDTALEINWGAKRGGYECSGGSCVNLPPFRGVQVILKRVLG